MRKHELLDTAERERLLAIPTSRDDLARLYTLEPSDIELIRLRRGDRNRLGLGLQLALFRHPGMTLAQHLSQAGDIPKELVRFIAEQLDISPSRLGNYATRTDDDGSCR